MEHLPRPRKAFSNDRDIVRYVAEPYDGEPFLTYPLRAGRPYVLPSEGNEQIPFWQHEKLHPTPNAELETFFQTWLFFGLLREVLGDIYRADDFIGELKVGDEVQKVTTTASLHGHLGTWVQQVHDGLISPSYLHIAQCLQLTHSSLRAVGPMFDLALLFSLASTGELIEFAANEAFHIKDQNKDNKCPAAWRPLFKTQQWASFMQANGWCSSQIPHLLQGALSVQSMYFFLCMTRADSPVRHQNCDFKKCVAYQNNLQRYQTKHVSDNCDCKELNIDGSVTDKVLQEGALPLLRILPGQELSDLEVEVVPSSEWSCYVALSHVWADGLGNPFANALPRCQLLFLSEACSRLRAKASNGTDQGELLLWCDTLCCPIGPKDAKDRALSRMRETYESATFVLVLDSSIRVNNSSDLSPEEICTVIFSSGWMRRLWTLQEGAIPAPKGRLWFYFQDKDLNLRHLWNQILNAFAEDFGRRGIMSEIITRIRGFATVLPRSKADGTDAGADLSLIDTALQDRSVSVMSDEPLLIANLLNLNLDVILSGPEETRINRLWTLMPTAPRGIPKSILFRLGPKLKAPGLRWAPSTMLFHEQSNAVLQSSDDIESQGSRTSRGLVCTLPGFNLSWPTRPAGLPNNPWNLITDDIVYMRDECGIWYLLKKRQSEASPSDGDFRTSDTLPSLIRSNTQLSIVYLKTNFKTATSFSPLGQAYPGLVVKLIEVQDKIPYVNSYMPLHIGVQERATQGLFEAAYHAADVLLRSEIAQRLIQFSDDGVDMENTAYKAAFDLLQPEILRLAELPEQTTALAVARQSSGKDPNVLFGALVAMIFIGHYAIAERTSDLQRWCID